MASSLFCYRVNPLTLSVAFMQLIYFFCFAFLVGRYNAFYANGSMESESMEGRVS